MGNRANAVLCFGIPLEHDMPYEEAKKIYAILGVDGEGEDSEKGLSVTMTGDFGHRALAVHNTIQTTDWNDILELDVDKMETPDIEMLVTLQMAANEIGLKKNPKWLLLATYW